MSLRFVLAGLALLSAAWSVHAQDASTSEQRSAAAREDSGSFASALRVEVISCVLEESVVDVSEMLAIARAELAPHVLVRGDEQNTQPLLRVDACHDERLVLKLLSPEGSEQSIALHDVSPEHRPRVAALALAELVLTARTLQEWRAERAAKSEAPAVTVAPNEGTRPATAKPERSAAVQLPEWNPPLQEPGWSRLGLGTEARVFLQRDFTVSYGPRIFVRLPRVDLALLGLISRRRLSLGELRTGLVAVSVAAHVWRSRGPLECAVSLGAELGVTWGRAEPKSKRYGETELAQAQFASAFGQLSIGGAISDHAFAHAALAVGYALGVHGQFEGQRAGTLGPFAGLAAGLTWLL